MKKQPIIIGLTGGLAAGKSSILNFFHQLGVNTYNADETVRELIAKNGRAYPVILKHFGHDILDKNQEFDRAKLRSIIFSQAEQKRWLEEYLHPLVRKSLLEQIHHAKSAYVIVEIPLLAEAKIPFEWIDRVLVIDANEDLQQQRAEQRSSLTKEQSRLIMNQQASREQRLQIADDIVYNNGDLLELELAVKRLHNEYQSLTL